MTAPEKQSKAAGAPVVSVRGAVKSFPRFRLGPVNLEVEPGYVVAVVGPNGSGKTTLFGLLMDLIHADRGDVELFGLRYPEDNVRIKRKIGYVPERSVGHDEMTARDLGSFVGRWYPSWNERRYAELLRRNEIDADQKFGRLSKGMQRRLAFALAVAREPELLLLDEPTEGLDPFARRAMLEDITGFVDSGEEHAVLLATHLMEEVRRIADYVAFLVDGSLLGPYQKDALLDNWRALWTEKAPEGPVPGAVSVEDGRPTRLVTRSVEETLAALDARGIEVLKTDALELEEILAYLMDEGG